MPFLVTGIAFAYNVPVTDIVLQTKLFMPEPRPNLVDRPSLIHRLNSGLGPGPGFTRKLTLVSAPAGYGKTTLVANWLQRRFHRKATNDIPPPTIVPTKMAWLSLDVNDNDATRFLTYFIAALQTVDENIGQNVSHRHPSVSPPEPNAVMALLLNRIAAGNGRFICVLDDYHLITNRAVHDSLRLLLAQMPPRMHLVLISRADPPLPLARLRVAGQMTEIRAQDLRFSVTETAAFLNDQRHLSLTDEAINTLERRTEGWIAGLQLAAMALQEASDAGSLLQAFAGDHRYLADYLMSEVLSRQPAEVRQFLLQTAVLERLTGPLCDAVRFGNAETPGLCLNYAWALFASKGRFQEIRALLHHLPRPLPDSYRGELLALRTSMAYSEGRIEEMMALADHALEHLSDSDDVVRGLIRADLAKAHFFGQGNTQKAVALLQETLPLFLANGQYLLWARDMDLLIAIRLRQGLLQEAADLCRQALAWAADHDLQPLAIPFYSQLGKVLYERNDLATAAETLRQGLEIGRGGHRLSAFVSGSITLARIQQWQEDAAGAQETLQEAREVASSNPWQLKRLQSWQAWPLMAHGWVALAVKWAAARQSTSAGSPTYHSLFYHLKLARERINRMLVEPDQPTAADLEQTIALLEKLSQLARTAQQQGTLIEILVPLALAYQMQAENEAALSTLDRALALAESAGYVRTFVDEGVPLARLLQTLAAQHQAGHKPNPDCSPRYVRTLLAALAPVLPPDTTTPLTEPLSPRQREILQLLGQGLSNPEIAQRLHIAVSTVRWHVKNIYRKLDVHNRTQAALRARALGILVE